MVAFAVIFASPWWLAAVPVVAVAALGLWNIASRRAARRIGLFLSPGSARDAVTPIDARRQKIRFALPAAVIALVCVALARPLVGPKPGHAERKGVDFVVALDVSKSMWTEDVAPNRLEAVKAELADWMKQASGDRMGLVIFAGEALIQAPVTFDFKALERVLKTATPRAISKGGTNIPKAIEMAATLLNKTGLDTRALVIFSDGENLDGDAVAAARTAHTRDGMSIFTVGVGTAAGARIPQVDASEWARLPADRRQRLGFIRNEYGTEVVSRLDDSALRAIAAAGGGRYEPFVPQSGFLRKLRDTALLPLAKNRKILNVQDYHELFPLPLLLAVLLIMVEPLVVVTRPRTDRGIGVAVVRPETYARPGGGSAGPSVRAALVALCLGLAPGAARSADPVGDQVAALLKEGNAEGAVAVARSAAAAAPQDPIRTYNLGLTLYQAGHLEEAIEVFQNGRSAAGADEKLQARFLFQLGNAQFRLGERLGAQPGAVLSMERALAFYEELLVVRSSSDGEFNRDAAKKALEAILTRVARDRLRTADDLEQRQETTRLSRVLQEALEAQERLASLEPKDVSRAEQRDATKKRLAESLKKDAARHIAETDRLEAGGKPEDDRKVLGRREQGIEILRQAEAQAPADASLPDGVRREQEKMAALLTRRAEEKARPILKKERISGGDLHTLDRTREDLARARELDPQNAQAAQLEREVESRMEKDLLAQAESNLKGVERQRDARAKLRAAGAAGEQFQKVLDINPANTPAQEGRDTVNALLPQLHADAAGLDLAEAETLLAARSGEQDSLKRAVGYLETSTQNFARSLALQPESGSVQAGYDKAQKLLSASRDELDQQRQARARQGSDAEGAETGEEGKGAAQPDGPSKMQVYQPPQTGQGPSLSSGAFWNKNHRDW